MRPFLEGQFFTDFTQDKTGQNDLLNSFSPFFPFHFFSESKALYLNCSSSLLNCPWPLSLQCFSNFSIQTSHLGIVVKCRFDSVRLRQGGLRVCLSHKISNEYWCCWTTNHTLRSKALTTPKDISRQPTFLEPLPKNLQWLSPRCLKLQTSQRFFFFFLKLNLFLNFTYLFIYGCVGSSFLCEGFL